MGAPQEISVCKQQAISNLCRGVHETPLFVVGASNSEFECRCDEGFFKAATDNSAPCAKCPDGAFCPVFTNHHFRCPSNTKLDMPVATALLHGIQRLLSLHAGSSFCEADPGYRLRHAHADINALILAGRSWPTTEFYSSSVCHHPLCFQRILCDVVGSPLLFEEDMFPHGKFSVSSTTSVSETSCEICPSDSFCIAGIRHFCKARQYTLAQGYFSEDDCKCLSRSYKTHDTSDGCVDIVNHDYYSRECVSASD